MGISNGFGTLSGMFCPIVVESMTEDKVNNASATSHYFPDSAYSYFLLWLIFWIVFKASRSSQRLCFPKRCFIFCIVSVWYFQKDKATIDDNWQSVFITASVIHFIGVVFYAFFASGELQPWAELKMEDDDQQPPAVAWNAYDPNAQKAGFNREQQSLNQDYSTTVLILYVYSLNNAC